MERKIRHPFRKDAKEQNVGSPFAAKIATTSLSEKLRETGCELVLVFNCAWHNPLGSPGRTQLEKSLKPNEVISDGICPDCEKKYFGE